MTDDSPIKARQFSAADGVEDWRVVFGGGWACAHFRTGSFATGAALVQAVSRLTDAVDHPYLDVDLRPASVSIRLHTFEFGGLSDRDAKVARQISEAARELGVTADPSAVQHIQIAIDAMDPAGVRPFWRAVLGYDEFEETDLIDPNRRGPTVWFQQMDEPRPQRNRFHVDVYLPHDQVEARIAAAVAAGGRIVSDAHAPGWWTLADAEGNEVDLAVWD